MGKHNPLGHSAGAEILGLQHGVGNNSPWQQKDANTRLRQTMWMHGILMLSGPPCLVLTQGLPYCLPEQQQQALRD